MENKPEKSNEQSAGSGLGTAAQAVTYSHRAPQDCPEKRPCDNHHHPSSLCGLWAVGIQPGIGLALAYGQPPPR